MLERTSALKAIKNKKLSIKLNKEKIRATKQKLLSIIIYMLI